MRSAQCAVVPKAWAIVAPELCSLPTDDPIDMHPHLRNLSIALAALAFSQQATAQFEVGDNVAGLSIGIGGNYVSNTSQSPAIGLSFEHGVTELGVGTLGIGGFLGYKSLSYESN